MKQTSPGGISCTSSILTVSSEEKRYQVEKDPQYHVCEEDHHQYNIHRSKVAATLPC